MRLTRMASGKKKTDNNRNENMSNRPWFKPPPLESIQVNNNELNGNFILRICALLNLFTGFTGMLGLLVLSMTVYVSLNVFNALDMTFILIFINN